MGYTHHYIHLPYNMHKPYIHLLRKIFWSMAQKASNKSTNKAEKLFNYTRRGDNNEA